MSLKYYCDIPESESVIQYDLVNYITPLKKNLLNSPVAALGICFGRGLRYHCTLYIVILPLPSACISTFVSTLWKKDIEDNQNCTIK